MDGAGPAEDERASVHAARCLMACHWLFDAGCTALAQRQYWGHGVIKSLVFDDSLRFMTGLPALRVDPVAWDHLHIATARAAVLRGDEGQFHDNVVPCLLWLRIEEVRAHLDLARQSEKHPDDAHVQANKGLSSQYLADTERSVCSALMGCKTIGVLHDTSPTAPFGQRLKKLNRMMPAVATSEHLIPSLLKGSDLDSEQYAAILDPHVCNAGHWGTLFEAYHSERSRLLEWVSEKYDDKRSALADMLRNRIDVETATFDYLARRESRTDPPALYKTNYYADAREGSHPVAAQTAQPKSIVTNDDEEAAMSMESVVKPNYRDPPSDPPKDVESSELASASGSAPTLQPDERVVGQKEPAVTEAIVVGTQHTEMHGEWTSGEKEVPQDGDSYGDEEARPTSTPLLAKPISVAQETTETAAIGIEEDPVAQHGVGDGQPPFASPDGAGQAEFAEETSPPEFILSSKRAVMDLDDEDEDTFPDDPFDETASKKRRLDPEDSYTQELGVPESQITGIDS